MTPNRPVEIGFIAVNYNAAKATTQLLTELMRQYVSHCTLTVVVADCSPQTTGLTALREAYRNHAGVHFEIMHDNPGYFGAARLALEAVWKNRLPDWVIVSNVDIRLPQVDLLARIAELPTGFGVIAPRIVSGNTGLDQNPFMRRRPSKFRSFLNRIIPRVQLLYWMLLAQCHVKRAIRSRILRSKRFAPPAKPAGESTNIYAPHGSFILFNREYFERGGNLRSGAFMYGEEIFVAETCRRIGLNVTYLPALEVLHDEHVSTAGNPAVRGFMASAADYCFREFFAKPRINPES